MKQRANILNATLLGLALLTTCAPSLSADTSKGQQLYSANCAMCHGQTGRSVLPNAPNFDRGEGLLRPDFALLAAIRAGKNAMPAFQGILADREIMDVIAFLRTLR